MRLHDLASVSVKEKNLKITDFKSYTKSFLNAELKKDKIAPSFSSTTVCNFTLYDKLLEIREVGGRLFVTGEKGALYEATSGKPVKVLSTTFAEFETEKVIADGENKVLIIFPNGGNYLVGEYSSAESCGCTVYSTVHATLGDGIFFGLKNKIVFDNFSNLDSFTESAAKNFIILPDEAGEIIALVGKEKKMLVFCERAIYELTLFGNAIDYKISRLLTFNGKAEAGSVCRVGEDILLVIGGSLHVYSNGNLKAVDTVTDIGSYEIFGKAAGMDDKYILPLKRDEKYYVLIYGKEDSSEQLFQSSRAKITDGGYFISSMTVNKLDGDGGNGTAEWNSVELDFGSSKLKNLKEIILKSNREITLTVKGEFGSESFYLMNNRERVKLNVISRYFTLNLKGDVGIDLTELRLVYRIKGE